MSLIHRRKSIIFNNPETTAQRIKIIELIQAHKLKLSINNRSSSKPKINQKQKLSLRQAVKLEELQQHMSQTRRLSLNSLLVGFDQNCIRNIVEEKNQIDGRKMDLFRSGLHYRSVDRAQGAGVKKCAQEELQQYFNCEQSVDFKQKTPKIHVKLSKSSKYKNFASTNAFSIRSK